LQLRGHIEVRVPGIAVKRAKLGDSTDLLYWLRCRLEAPPWERAPRLDAVFINSVPAIQASQQRDEVLGASSARPNQSFTLSARPVLPATTEDVVKTRDGGRVTIPSLRLEVDEGSGPQPWQEVPDFYASGPDDPHFILN